MDYVKIVKAEFVARPNRFIAEAKLENEIVRAHVKNTGRLRELLTKGAVIYLEDFEGRMGKRKMRYSLVAVEKNYNGQSVIVNIDSQAPNKVVGEALKNGIIKLENMNGNLDVLPEKTFEKSRFDFRCTDEAGKTAFIEVKGVTLEEKGYALFPDAPTERGVKHVNELIKAVECGYKAYIIFVVQMSGLKGFMPNEKTHAEFAEALRNARTRGVNILAYDCEVSPKALKISKRIDVIL